MRIGAGAATAPAPLPQPTALLSPLAAGTGRPRDPVPALGGEGKEGAASPRAPLRLQCPGPAARAPPQPARAPRPSPSWLSPPSLGTMAEPSRHPLPPAVLALYLPDKAVPAAGPGRGLRVRTPISQGRPGGRQRDADPTTLTRGPGAPVWSWTLGAVGVLKGTTSPTQPPATSGRTGQERPPPRGR